jgi:hypothetical protein
MWLQLEANARGLKWRRFRNYALHDGDLRVFRDNAGISGEVHPSYTAWAVIKHRKVRNIPPTNRPSTGVPSESRLPDAFDGDLQPFADDVGYPSPVVAPTRWQLRHVLHGERFETLLGIKGRRANLVGETFRAMEASGHTRDEIAGRQTFRGRDGISRIAIINNRGDLYLRPAYEQVIRPGWNPSR